MPSSLLALLDDITSVLDDVAVLTKVAAKKTSGVIGDDLALNAQQVTGLAAERELPVVWAVAKGSAKNKLILVPAALALSYFAPWAVMPLLMFGGAFLCYEGFEKLAHKYLHSRAEDEAHEKELRDALADPKVDLVALERDKIKGAIRTDLILSAEIVAITLGSVAEKPFMAQVGVLVIVSAIMTVGVYGFVGGIVKLDDLGFWLSARRGFARSLGKAILRFAPILMKTLTIGGTLAMFMVGGGILSHGIPPVHHFIEHIDEVVTAVPVAGPFLGWLAPALLDAVVGVLAGGLALLLVSGVQKLLPKKKA